MAKQEHSSTLRNLKVYAKSNLERGEERRRCQTIPYHLRFPFYEPDFGWGKPPWVTSGTEFKNLILLMDTRDGDGIEVSLNLKEEDMAIFESTKELLEVI
ncbi:tabersonine-19-hydroxy-O-acetyltransferase-like isoform X3 [Pyrus communis]|uniref:tabersonine-19-hydroxy-O-acetyltransferase-like isoform X4 n=1 Tax=Pyrus communis TaxID=23211 RepID=UPI0035BECDE8